jgi:hypothetical protein
MKGSTTLRPVPTRRIALTRSQWRQSILTPGSLRILKKKTLRAIGAEACFTVAIKNICRAGEFTCRRSERQIPSSPVYGKNMDLQ